MGEFQKKITIRENPDHPLQVSWIYKRKGMQAHCNRQVAFHTDFIPGRNRI